MATTPAADPVSKPAETAPAAPRRRGTSLIWAAVACVLLGSSAVVRGLQESRHKDEASYHETCPFPLEQIPADLGIWKMVSAGDQKLDQDTMRITGGTDHILRTYVDKLTGVKLVVLLLFGPVEPVIPHTPEACYPANGFSNAMDATNRDIKYTNKDASGQDHEAKATFRSAVYQKSGGRGMVREGVYHSFRLEGRWSPNVGAGRKFPRRNPGVFKIQVQRMVADGERRADEKNIVDPIEQFLGALIPEIEREISAAPAPKSVAAK
jgi:hypothetical protein